MHTAKEHKMGGMGMYSCPCDRAAASSRKSDSRPRRLIRFIAAATLPLLAICLALPSCAQSPATDPPSASSPATRPAAAHAAEARHGMVVSVSLPASEVGRDILQRGGNAVDAAVATAFALAVTFPAAGNIGGGGFMLVYQTGKDPVMFDYRETAPAAATATMFASGKPTSYALVGTPGTVRGLALAHQRLGRLPWKELVLPAVRLADEGFAVDAHVARSFNDVLRKNPQFAELHRVFKSPTGSPWRAGDRLVQKDLARTLQAIADQGPDAFYTGPVAQALVDTVRSGGGIISKDDLSHYEARVRTPLHGTYRGYDIYSAPPPSSGGVGVIEMLNILENFNLRQQGRYSPQTLHTIIETMRRAYLDRAKYLGDPDFVPLPAQLLDKAYAKRLAASIDLTKATPSETLAKESEVPISGEGEQTTHFSIIDEQGMAVANTFTLEDGYGGKIVVNGAGFLLNNEMGDFNPKPGITDRKGTIGTLANQVAPGKRMLSSMTPTIVAKDGKPILITGSPGGRTIINTVLCVTLNVLEFNMSPREAVDAPRMHHQWFPDRLEAEPGLLRNHAAAVDQLRKMGQVLNAKPVVQGDAHTIWIDPATGIYTGVADDRTSGAAVGY
jgi:gamma-glutamyltranspeptidase/glutathione hydrolase